MIYQLTLISAGARIQRPFSIFGIGNKAHPPFVNFLTFGVPSTSNNTGTSKKHAYNRLHHRSRAMPAARAAADGSSGEASVGEQEHMLPFERARQQRIAANRAVFVSMGLEELHQQLQQECSSGRGERKAGETQRGGGEVPRRSRRQAGKRASEAQRHSKRQAGENAELPLGMEHLARWGASEGVPFDRSAAQGQLHGSRHPVRATAGGALCLWRHGRGPELQFLV